MDDLISRKDAIDAINEEMGRHGDLDPAGWGLMIARDCIIAKMPSAQPERSKGHWVYDPDGMDWNIPAWVCSECYGRNDMIPTYIKTSNGMVRIDNPMTWSGSRFCPNCGAEMKDGEENG